MAQRQNARVTSAFTNRLGQPCRVVEQDVWIGGETVKASGTVCEQPNGVWAVMK
jgi:surface antigen